MGNHSCSIVKFNGNGNVDVVSLITTSQSFNAAHVRGLPGCSLSVDQPPEAMQRQRITCLVVDCINYRYET